MAGPGSVALVSSTSDPTGTSRWLRLGQHALLAVLAVVPGLRMGRVAEAGPADGAVTGPATVAD